MKLSLILAALGAIPFAAADVAVNADIAANGPYNEVYNKYCGGGKTQGEITSGDKKYTYYCNTKRGLQDGWFSFNVDTVDKCADICSQNQEKCDGPEWDKAQGECWIGKGKGGHTEQAGRILMEEKSVSSQLSSCKADLEKWGPKDPVCEYS